MATTKWRLSHGDVASLFVAVAIAIFAANLTLVFRVLLPPVRPGFYLAHELCSKGDLTQAWFAALINAILYAALIVLIRLAFRHFFVPESKAIEPTERGAT